MRTFEQHPSAVLDYSADFGWHCRGIKVREPDTDYALNTAVRPVRATGFQYKATTAGHSATAEPRWPTTVGATVQDGSITWTCEAVGAGSLVRTISGIAWSATTGLTVGTSSYSDTKGTALVGPGVDGQDYEVTALATFSDGTKEAAVFAVQVRSRPVRVVEA